MRKNAKLKIFLFLFITFFLITSTSGIFAENLKDPGAYSTKEVFLVSALDWRDVVTLVPLAAWTNSDKSISKYPLLIFHEETGNSVDIDSLIYFLQQYGPDKVTFTGTLPGELETLLVASQPSGAGLESSQLHSISLQDLVNYWITWDDVVVVDAQYEHTLLASAYASLINAPLIIEGFNDTIDLTGKHVICVGNTATAGNEIYSSDELIQLYSAKTLTDKIIITNPDLTINIEDIKTTVKTGSLYSLFGKTSLAASYLAACKHELILPVHSTVVDEIDSELDNYRINFDLHPQYLTILGSPPEIQHTILVDLSYDDANGHHEVFKYWSIDNTVYGNLDNDLTGFVELKTGRIYGFTISDVSACIARSVFYDTMNQADDLLFIGQGVGNSDRDAEILSGIFNTYGYTSYYKTEADPARAGDWQNKKFINNSAHGGTYSSTIITEDIPLLSNTFILTASCSIASFDNLTANNYGRLFALQLLRNGATGVVAATDTSGFTFDMTRINTLLTEDTGTVIKKDKNIHHARSKWYDDENKEGNYTDLSADIQCLLGDPTLKIPFHTPFLPPINQDIGYTGNTITINVDVPTWNSEYDTNSFTLMEGNEEFYTSFSVRFFLKIGPIDLFPAFSIECDEVDISIYAAKEIAAQNEDNDTFIYLLMGKDFSANPPGQVVNNAFSVRLIEQTPAFTVDAGPDAEITLPVNTVSLNSTVALSDVLVQWSKTGGPGIVVFDDSNSEDITALFSKAGLYTLRLRADSSGNTNYDEVLVTVHPEEQSLTGDVNRDGLVDIVDALLVAQYYVGLAPPAYTAPVETGDVNCDDLVDIVDALLIAQYYVGIIDTLC